MSVLDAVQRKMFDHRFPWADIRKELAVENTAPLDKLREACLIESYFAVYTGKMMEKFWYDMQAVSMFTIEATEAFGHYFMLRRYLEIIDYCPVQDKEIIALREKDRTNVLGDEITELVNFMATEHFAAHFFKDIASQIKEPVLQRMLNEFSGEEVVHARFAFTLLKERLNKNPSLKGEIVQKAKHFHHVGTYVLASVSNAKEDNIRAIQQYNLMVEELTGTRPSDFSE